MQSLFFCCCFVLATSFWTAAGGGQCFCFSQTHVFFLLHSSVLSSLSWSGFVAPSWWQPTIEAQPERWVAVIHTLAEQTSLKGSTVPNISWGWSEYFRLPSYCPRHFFPKFFSSGELVFGFNLQQIGSEIQHSLRLGSTLQIPSFPKRILNNKSMSLICHRSAAPAARALAYQHSTHVITVNNCLFLHTGKHESLYCGLKPRLTLAAVGKVFKSFT